MSYSFLASPYSHESLAVRVNRFLVARGFLVWAFEQRLPVFSPIVQWHQIALTNELPWEAEFWTAQNDVMLAAARDIIILAIPGWRESVGVQNEIAMGRKLGKLIFTAELFTGPNGKGYRITEFAF